MWDPITAAHQAIFAALQNYPALAAVVLPGNFIDTTNPYFQQFKPDVQASDTPQVKILQGEFSLPPFGGNSTTVQFTQAYRLFFCTDVLQATPLNQLKYLALIALVKAGPNLGLSCVSGFDVLAGKDEPQSEESQRWAAVFTIHVHLYMPRQQLAAL